MGSIDARPLLAFGAVLLLSSAAPVQQYTVLVGTIGSDTVAVDRFLRTVNRLEGVVLVRKPTVQTMHYSASLAPEGRFSTMQITWRDAKGVELRTANISFGTDSIRSELKQGTARNFAAPPQLDAIPLPPPPYGLHCYSLIEHAAMVFLLSKQPGMTTLDWINAGATKADKRSVRRSAGDTLVLDYVAGPVRALADSTNRVVWISIGASPQQVVVQRSASDINIEKLTSSFASRDTL